LLSDDYTLTILPLACLMAENTEVEQYCARASEDSAAYHEVLRSGVLGYKLYTYHNLVRAWFGVQVEQRVRDHHLDMLSHIAAFAPMMTIIDGAVHVGAVTTSTLQGDVVTPVEMNVALALLLGMPESANYASSPGQQIAQITRIPPEIDCYFAGLLAHGRREMVRTFEAMMKLPDISESLVACQRQ